MSRRATALRILLSTALIPITVLMLATPASAHHVAPLIHDYNMKNQSRNERELSIAVDPNNPNRLGAGSNQRNGSQAWYTSVDGGRTWTEGVLPNGTLTLAGTTSTSMSDPSLAYGSGGQLYYAALMHDAGSTVAGGTLFVSESGDQGANWTDPANGVVASAGNPATVLQDKEHIAVDRGHNDNVYVAWTPIGGANDQKLMFSRDTGGVGDGFAFSAPIQLSTQTGNGSCLNQGGTLSVDGNNLYVAWTCFSSTADGAASTVWVTRSTDQGQTFSAPVKVADLKNFAVTSGYGAGFRTRSHPAISADPISHRVFVVYTDEIGTNTNGDIRISQSTDNGATWSTPVTVNTDGGTSDQFLPWVTSGQIPGTDDRVFVNFYSRSDDATNINQHIAWSTVGNTLNFTETKVSSVGTPATTGFLGDYTFVALGSDGVVHPAWADGRPGVGGATDAFSARVDFSPPTQLAVSPASTSVPAGNTVTYTATVTGAHGEAEQFIPVKFTVTGGGTPTPSTATVTTNASGQAAFSFTNNTASTNNVHIWADLNEDNTEQAATESTDRTSTWTNHNTTTTLTSSVNPSVFGQPVTFTATVADSTGPSIGQPSGQVQFFDGATLLGSGNLNGSNPDTATFTTSSLSVGSHTIHAAYQGGTNFNPSNETTPVTQVVNKAPTTTTVITSGTPSNFGSAVTFTATVSPAPPSTNPPVRPSGSIVFSVDGTPVSTVPVNQPTGTAAFGTAGLQPGTHTITATYSGDGNFLTSTGSVMQTVICTNNLTGNINSSLTLSAGSWCIKDASVAGAITGGSGAAVSIQHSTVGGSVTLDRAVTVGICGSTIQGAVRVTNATGFVLLGGPGDDGCAANTVVGGTTFQSNTGGLEVATNHLASLLVISNSGVGPFPEDTMPSIEANTLSGSLYCSGNTPGVTNDGQQNNVSGSRSGQCSGSF